MIDFLVAIVGAKPPVPDQVRSILADPDASYLFLGFGFHNWYLRVLLKVLGVYGHRNKAIAFEDPHFFNHPDREQAVAFFSDDRRIDFRPLRWELFARQLWEAYKASLPSQQTTEAMPARAPTTPNAPKAFISYASEDREAVRALAEKLEARGVRVWRDEQDLRAGDKWSQVLLGVINRKVDYVVVVQTPGMTTAIRGVFHREIEAALLREAEMGEFEGEKTPFRHSRQNRRLRVAIVSEGLSCDRRQHRRRRGFASQVHSGRLEQAHSARVARTGGRMTPKPSSASIERSVAAGILVLVLSAISPMTTRVFSGAPRRGKNFIFGSSAFRFWSSSENPGSARRRCSRPRCFPACGKSSFFR